MTAPMSQLVPATTVFMNLRGYGERKDVTGKYTTEEAAADALRLAGSLGGDCFSLIGHSMGWHKLIQRVLVEASHQGRELIPITPVSASGVSFDGDT